MVELDIKGQGSKLCFIISDTGSGVTWILAGETEQNVLVTLLKNTCSTRTKNNLIAHRTETI